MSQELLADDGLFVSHMLTEIGEEMTDELAAMEAAADFMTERQAQQMGIGYE
ncbi:hypothetical protein PTR52_24365 [Serratia nevei]|uniref:hypothetical protein n=1 Tax=Serratia TaxID=613 RepID=UPI0007452464|nr:hypothetical protein [Serratia marcescens]CUZ60169.1 Uncharacterised protein [Serratia marcescens]CVB52000.1 Uncharacterised protein [Serratia marcescens]CVB93412.1 Uncharacterised protein [Serratia marcescens]CVF19274.1 Uncharacterised protein [Serratia marcescens]